MLLQATSGVPRSAHVIVLGNEKGGSGKSTTAMHIAVALLKAGQRVATIDLDSRQKTFTHYVENRRDAARRSGKPLEVPDHFCIARAEGIRVDENEAAEFGGFAAAINEAEHTGPLRRARKMPPYSPKPGSTPAWARDGDGTRQDTG